MSFTDDCERLMRLLLDDGPLAKVEIQDRLDWSITKVHTILTDLVKAGQVGSETGYYNGIKIVKYKPKGI